MVDAGVSALYEYRDSYGDRQLVEAVYTAMQRRGYERRIGVAQEKFFRSAALERDAVGPS